MSSITRSLRLDCLAALMLPSQEPGERPDRSPITPRNSSVPPARTGQKGRKPSSAFVQVEATYGLGA